MLAAMMVISMIGCGRTESASNTETEETAEETVVEEIEENQTEEGTTKTIVDQAGVEMEIPTQIDRVVVGAWQMAAPLAVYLGGGEKIVGMAPASYKAVENGILGELYPELLNAKTEFYNGGDINMEELLKLDPDIVIGVSASVAETIRKAGIPALVVSVSDWGYDVIDTFETWHNLFDDIFGGSAYSGDITAYSREVQAAIEEKVSVIPEEERKKVMVLFTYSDEVMTTSGSLFFGQSWCDLTGAVNVGAEITTAGSATIDMEQVYEWNPDVIIITNFTSAQPEDLYNNAIGGDDWSTVAAVQNGQVYKMPLGVYRTYTPGVDTPVTLQWFAKAVYPELFEDVDVEQEAKDYFTNYLQIELTDEQIESIFNPSSEASAY